MNMTTGRERRTRWLLPILVAMSTAAGAAEEDPPEAEGAPPACEYCRFEIGEEGSVTAGGMVVSNDNHRYGQYRGLDEEGAYLLLDLHWQSVSEDGRRFEFSASDLGVDGRAASLLYERQGSHGLRVDYTESPRSPAFFGARTPFLEQQGYDNVLGLPGGWVDSGNVSSMPGLANALHAVDLSTQRRRVLLGIDLDSIANWEFDVAFRHDEKDGTHLRAASFLTNAMQLPLPRDFTTDDMEATASYRGESITAQFGYYLSTFTNTHQALVFENPFTPIAGGADQGALALEPDNEFHQFNAALTWQFGQSSQLHYRSAFGTGTQDQRFLPVTMNSLLATSVLPRESLDGEVETENHRLRFTTRLGSDVSIQANLRKDLRDNRSPSLVVTPVITDTYVGSTTTSRGYDYERNHYDVAANWRPNSDFRLRAAIERKDIERTHLEREETTEDITWVEARISPFERMGIQLRYLESDRDGSTVIFDEPGAMEENPLLRRFHLADRERRAWRAAIDFDPLDWLLFTVATEFREDVYPASVLGMTLGESRNQSIDASIIASHSLRFSAFASHDEERSLQAGSESFSDPDWTGTTRDETWTSGLSADYTPEDADWDLRMTLSVSEFEGETDVDTWTDGTPFPDLVAQLYRADLRYRHRFENGNTLIAGYVYEEYDARNWQVDAAGVTSVPTLLSMGQTSPDYHVSIVSVSYQWRF